MTQGDGMGDVTEADREKARSMVVEWTRGENLWLTDAIAAALAEEREKARAPFLAVPDWDTRYWSVLATTVCKCGHRAIDHELRASEGQTPCSVCGCGEYRHAAEEG